MQARDRLYGSILGLVVLVVVIRSFGLVAETRAAEDQTLLLEVVINGVPSGKIGEFVLRDGALFARRGELADVGVKVPESAAETKDGLIALDSLPGVTSAFDRAKQTLSIKAVADSLMPELLQTGMPAGETVSVESGTGVTLDYDIAGTSTGGQRVGIGAFDLRVFSPWGVLSSGAITYAGASPSGPGRYSAIRLDSTYVYSDPDALRRYRLGDFINSGLSWTRPVRLGGAQIESDFSLRPDLVTFPLPVVGGTAAVPSTVDVMVNGAQLLTRQIQPGPFQIPGLPVVTGAGTVAMTLTDALGHQVTTTLPFYTSADLLAPGLQTYSVEAGAVRRNWGLLSNDYGNIAAAGTYRRGLSPNITIEAHAEGTKGQFMAGGGLVMNVFDLGVVNLAVAASAGSGRTGTQFSIGAQRIGPVFSLGASAIIASRDFRDIAAMNGDPVPRRQISANAGLSLGRFGSIGVAYIAIDRDTRPAPISFFAPPGTILAANTTTRVPGGSVTTQGNFVTFQPAQHSQILSASYSLQIGNASLYATGYHDFASSGASGVLFGVTLPLGSRSSASATGGTGSTGAYAQVQAVQSAVSVGDWGYQVYGAAGNPYHQFAQAQYKSPWGLVSAGADRIGAQTTFRVEAQGALSYTDGGVFASNTISDSFGVVDTNGTRGVRVYSENREMGRTDSSGRLLVPDLRSFDVNHIGLEPSDIPADATVPYITRDVRPQDRSGVVVRFPVKASRGALVKLVDDAGAPIPVGSTAALEATKATVPIGYDGEAYVVDLAPGKNTLLVQRPGGQRCVAVFEYKAAPGEIPSIGPLRCTQEQP